MAEQDNAAPTGASAPQTMAEIEDKLGSFDFDAPEATPAGEPPEQQPVNEAEPTELAGEVAEAEPAQSEDDREEVLRDGKRIKVSELKRGYRDDWEARDKQFQDYQRQVAEFQKATTGFTELQQKQAYMLQQVVAIAARNIPQKPDLALLETDPLEFQKRNAHWEAKMGELNQLRTMQVQQWQQAQYQAQQARQQRLQREHGAILQQNPDLKDPVKSAKFLEELRAYVVTKGYAPADLSLVEDHRLVGILSDAMKVRKMEATLARAKSKREETPPVEVQPPSRRRTSADNQAEQLRARLNANLKRSGRFEDAVAAMSQWD